MTVQYLIDSENIGDFWIPLLELPDEETELIVFYTKNSPHMSYESLIRLKESDKKVTFVKCYEGTNALDFQLVSELGYRICQNEEGRFVVVTNDTGYDAAVKYWRRKKRSVKRITGKECRNLERRLREDILGSDSVLRTPRAPKAVPREEEGDGHEPRLTGLNLRDVESAALMDQEDFADPLPESYEAEAEEAVPAAQAAFFEAEDTGSVTETAEGAGPENIFSGAEDTGQQDAGTEDTNLQDAFAEADETEDTALQDPFAEVDEAGEPKSSGSDAEEAEEMSLSGSVTDTPAETESSFPESSPSLERAEETGDTAEEDLSGPDGHMAEESSPEAEEESLQTLPALAQDGEEGTIPDTEPAEPLPASAGDPLSEAAEEAALPEAEAGEALPEAEAGDSLPEAAAGDSLPEAGAGEALPETTAETAFLEAAVSGLEDGSDGSLPVISDAEGQMALSLISEEVLPFFPDELEEPGEGSETGRRSKSRRSKSRRSRTGTRKQEAEGAHGAEESESGPGEEGSDRKNTRTRRKSSNAEKAADRKSSDAEASARTGSAHAQGAAAPSAVPADEEIARITACIGADNLAELHNQLATFYGDQGKDIYLSIKNGTRNLSDLHPDLKQKFSYYCEIIFAHSEEPEEVPADMAEYLLNIREKLGNLNSLRYALIKHYGKEKGRRYYFLLKPYAKTMHQM